MNVRFLLKEDMIIRLDVAGTMREVKLFDKGRVFEPNERGEYVLESVAGQTILSLETMKTQINPDTNRLLFEMIEEEQKIDIIIEEVLDGDEEIEKKWRLQFDITTTRSKLREIEKFINDNIRRLL